MITPLIASVLAPVHPSEVDKTSARQEIKTDYRRVWGEAQVAVINYHAHHKIRWNLNK